MLPEQFTPKLPPRLLVMLGVFSVAALMLCSCSAQSTAATQLTPTPRPTPTPRSTPTPTPTPNAQATVTAIAACVAPPPPPGFHPFPVLPPHTVLSGMNGAAGAGFMFECTPGATATSIARYMNTHLPEAGWRQWNPQKDTTTCPLNSSFWLWYQLSSHPTSGENATAVGWSFTQSGVSRPEWLLVICGRALVA